MGLQHLENLLRRHREEVVKIRTMFGGTYEGAITEINSDYVMLVCERDGPPEQTFVLLQSIEAVHTRKAEPKVKKAVGRA